MKKKWQRENGFTLVELMIVIAIIGILAVIAIPQINSFRIKGFNASALSDLKNAFSSEAAIFTVASQYGVSGQAQPPGTDPVAPKDTGVLSIGGGATLNGLLTTLSDGTAKQEPLSIGNGVSLGAITNEIPAAGLTATTFIVQSKHLNGDTTYAMDVDSANVYQNDKLIKAGVAMELNNVVKPTLNNDDFNGTANWSVR
ncbi:MAG: prepilin-type N-terminal cleavage/methylation domain-containing protein [Desulfobulbaceae bacterium]|jgi:prepilin-type N-terminal cleavage/methylation domain-containing protein|nr:prepilin-type N-terminal cleavage/methylation domain-containing protein [Desulfobulbaceae bacterium]